MNHKAFELKEVTREGTATAVIATLGVADKDGDVLEKGVFGQQRAQLVPSHDWKSVPLGVAMVRERGNEAIADLKFNLEIPAAKDWHNALVFDLANPPAKQEWSWGFTVLNGASKEGDLDGKSVRYLGPVNGAPGVKVHEVSPVLLGAGIDTRTIAAKSERSFADELRSVIERASSILELRARPDRKGSRQLPPERLVDLRDLRDALDELLIPAGVVEERLLADFERIKFELGHQVR